MLRRHFVDHDLRPRRRARAAETTAASAGLLVEVWGPAPPLSCVPSLLDHALALGPAQLAQVSTFNRALCVDGGPAPDGLKEPVSGGSADREREQKSSFPGGAARPSLEKAPCSSYPPREPSLLLRQLMQLQCSETLRRRHLHEPTFLLAQLKQTQFSEAQSWNHLQEPILLRRRHLASKRRLSRSLKAAQSSCNSLIRRESFSRVLNAPWSKERRLSSLQMLSNALFRSSWVSRRARGAISHVKRSQPNPTQARPHDSISG